MPLPNIDTTYLLNFLTELLNTPSPTGFSHRAIAFTEQALAAFLELKLSHTRKGALAVEWPVVRFSAGPWQRPPWAVCPSGHR